MKALEAIEAIHGYDAMYTARDAAPTVLHTASVTPTFPAFAGERPILGRTFVEDDSKPGAAPVVALSEGLWRSQFGGESSVLGRPMVLDGEAHTIIGVLQRASVSSPCDAHSALAAVASPACW